MFFVDRFSGHSLGWGDLPREDSEDDERGVHSEAYNACPWLLLAAWDELRVRYETSKTQFFQIFFFAIIFYLVYLVNFRYESSTLHLPCSGRSPLIEQR